MKECSGNPRYFLAVFGEKYAKTHPVHGGCYPVPRSFCPPGISEGDKIVLFCLRDYPVHGWTAPGIGKVIRIQHSASSIDVHYEYRPMEPPIGRSAIMDCLNNNERKQLKYPRLKPHWLREIEKASFNCIVRGRRVNLSRC